MLPENNHGKLLEATVNHGRLQTILLWVWIIGALGPYIWATAGIRLEHVLIYPVFILALAKLLMKPAFVTFPGTVVRIIGFLLFAALWTLLVSLLLPTSGTLGQITAGLENYIQPLAIILVLSMAVVRLSSDGHRHLLADACVAICVVLGVNTIIAVASVFFDMWPYVQYFVRGETEAGRSVWQNAVSNGRYSGIFNQPLESGLAYSIGLLAWGYLFFVVRKLNVFGSMLLISLIVGGLLSVSKIFIVGGIGVFLLYAIWNTSLPDAIRPRVIGFVLASLSLLVCVGAVLTDSWRGLPYLFRLFDLSYIAERGWVSTFTAGRFGHDGTTVKWLASETLTHAPVHGFGFGSFSPLDSGYVEFLYQGGLVALGLYIAILLSILLHAIRYYRYARQECRLLLLMMLLTIGAGMGAPVLTMNRSSIFLWVLIVLCIFVSIGSKRALCYSVLRNVHVK